MSQPLFTSAVAWLAAAVPVIVLAGIGLLGHVPGDWGRSALLAYAAVQLTFLIGLAVATGGLPSTAAHLIAAAGLLIAFGALALGGAWAHGLLAAAYAALTVAALLLPALGLPWPLAMISGIACVIAAARTA